MPINAGPEFFAAQKKYMEAKTREEKIIALEEMIRTAPGHKGAETLRAQLKSKLAKLKQQKEASIGRKVFAVPKKGDAQICILGLTQSGKSTLLSKLTNAKPQISSHRFTTTKPEVGTLDYGGVKIQIVEIPSTFQSAFMSIAQSSDAVMLLYRDNKEKKELEKIISEHRIRKPMIEVNNENLDEIKEKIWDKLNLIRVYCKVPNKKPEKKPLVLKKGANVEDAARNLHKDFIKFFKFARVWGSSKYPGEKVGFDHKLKDKDILEIHIT